MRSMQSIQSLPAALGSLRTRPTRQRPIAAGAARPPVRLALEAIAAPRPHPAPPERALGLLRPRRAQRRRVRSRPTHARTHARTHPPTRPPAHPPTHTSTPTHTHTHTHTHKHTHTHTHTNTPTHPHTHTQIRPPRRAGARCAQSVGAPSSRKFAAAAVTAPAQAATAACTAYRRSGWALPTHGVAPVGRRSAGGARPGTTRR